MATTTLHPAATTYKSGLYDWVTTTDHKKIGIMYIINSFLFFFIGGILALAVRSELGDVRDCSSSRPRPTTNCSRCTPRS